MYISKRVVVFEHLIGLLSSQLLGTKMDTLKSEKATFQTYFVANLAVMSQMQQDSSDTLRFACEFAHCDFFSVVHSFRENMPPSQFLLLWLWRYV